MRHRPSQEGRTARPRGEAQEPAHETGPGVGPGPLAPSATERAVPVDIGPGAGPSGSDKAPGETAAPSPGAPDAVREDPGELRDRLLRSLAEFENYRKRSRREQEEAVRRATDALLLEVLAVLDDFERGLEHAAGAGEIDGLRAGMEITLRSFRDFLGRRGVREMNALGEPFDPNRHEAVMEESDGAAPSGSVTRVLGKGYLLGDRVLRPARVAVAR